MTFIPVADNRIFRDGFRTRCVLILLLLIPLSLAAQIRHFTLNGSLGVESGETFSYKLVCTDSGGTISGYGITYLREANDTKATVKGTIDRKQKTLSFTETEIAYNHGFKSNAVICLLRATLKYIPEGGRLILSGPVISADAGNGACSRGSIRFEDEAALRELFREEHTDTVKRPAARTVVIRAPQPRTETATAQHTDSAPVTEEITAGREKVYEWHTDTVILELWDGGRIDGDIITIRYNGHPILSRYTLAKEKKRILLPLSSTGTDSITIIADNMGNEPPNTANLLLRDGDREHTVVAYNDVGKEAVIRIRKAPLRDAGKSGEISR